MDDIDFDAQEIQNTLHDYKFLLRLGSGSFGRVFLVEHKKTQQKLAVKKIGCFGMCEYEQKNATNEVRILASLDHPNIIKFDSSFFDSEGDDLYLFMEYAPGGDLTALVTEAREKKKRISEAQIWRILMDTAEGLHFLHKNGIIHRDIKPANIFKGETGFKVGDMNVSKITKNGCLAKTQIGSPYYTSPEIWSNKDGYNEKCDIWSLGVVCYELCCLKLPYEASSVDELVRKIKSQRLKDIPTGYSCALNELIHKMLQINPRKRLTAENVISMCQQFGKVTQREEIQTYVESLLDTIVLPETQTRWINLVPLPRKSVKKQQTETRENQKSREKDQKDRQQNDQKENAVLNRQPSSGFISEDNRSLLIPKGRSNNPNQKYQRVRLPSIIRQSSHDKKGSRSRQKSKSKQGSQKREVCSSSRIKRKLSTQYVNEAKKIIQNLSQISNKNQLHV